MRAFWCVFLPLSVAYATAVQWCIDRWNAPTQYYQHCWLVPVVAAVVLWLRRTDWRGRPTAVDPRGLWLLVPALLMHLAGAALMVESLSAASLVLAIPGAAWLALGRERLRGLWPVLWLSVFLVPTPIVVEGWMAFYLKEVAVTAGAGLANLLGADLARRGAELQLVGTASSLYVADACSGLRSLLAMLTISYCVAFFMGEPQWRRRAVLLALAVPIAVAANVVRIACLCLFARWFGVGFAEGTGHDLANAFEWVAAVLLLLGVDGLVSRGLVPTPAPATGPAATSVPTAPVGAWRRHAVWLYPAAALLLWLSLYKPAASGAMRAERLPEQVGAYQLVPRNEAEQAAFLRNLPRWRELLGTPDFVWRRYRAQDGGRVNLVVTYHDTNWKSVHAPRICIEGSNMDIERDDLLPAPWLGEPTTVSRIVARSRDDGWRYVTYSLFGTRTWSSGSYGEFAWHHMPLAILRRNESGFLLRVESPIEPGETDASAAERRCAAFLTELLPLSRQLLE
jgi:EpsI family protein